MQYLKDHSFQYCNFILAIKGFGLSEKMPDEKTLSENRLKLLNKLTFQHFDFQSVKLAEGVVIQISKVVVIDGFYLPVTAKETFEIARKFNCYPLTRAVADQIMNRAVFLPYRWQPELLNYVNQE